ncbi:hypothetical protein ACFVTM_08980 [Arthrobacter sp. NPDC058130]|uniref:hypothetical protein n=1 Tax=Arthrobacter sp. NPDC058130 TaxID=3346353 RepID=UPI0036E3E033
MELTSHANDLSEASHALTCALTAGQDSELWMPLTSQAVSAYVRPFIHSNVRTRLDKMPEVTAVPDPLQPVHDTIRKYRNTTVAHSQSNLVMPLPIAIRDAQGRGVNVVGITITHQMPLAVAQRFAELISAMEERVDHATQAVLERLRAWLSDQDPAVIDGWPFPDVAHATDSDFTAAHPRRGATHFTTYWSTTQTEEEPS